MGIRTRVWEAHDTVPKASPRQLKLKLEIVDASGGVGLWCCMPRCQARAWFDGSWVGIRGRIDAEFGCICLLLLSVECQLHRKTTAVVEYDLYNSTTTGEHLEFLEQR